MNGLNLKNSILLCEQQNPTPGPSVKRKPFEMDQINDDKTRKTIPDNIMEVQRPGVQLDHALEPVTEFPVSTNGENRPPSKDNKRKRKKSSRSRSQSKKQIMKGPAGPEQNPDQVEPFDQATEFCDSQKKKRKESKKHRKSRSRDESKTKKDEINLPAETLPEVRLDQHSGEPTKKLKLCRYYSQPKEPEAAVLELPIQPTPNDDDSLIDHPRRAESPEPRGKRKGSRGRSRTKKILVGGDPSPLIVLPELTPQAIPVPELTTSPQPELQLIQGQEPAPTFAPTLEQQSIAVTTVELQSISCDSVFPALDHSNSLPPMSEPTPAEVLEQILTNPVSSKPNTEKRKNSRSRSGSKRKVTKKDATEMSSLLQTQESPAEDQLPAAEALATVPDEPRRSSRTRKSPERWSPDFAPSRSKSRSKVTDSTTQVGSTESPKQSTRRGWKSKSPERRSKSTPPPSIESAPEVPLAVAPAPKLRAAMETPPDTITSLRRSGRVTKAPQRWEPEPIRDRGQSSSETTPVSRGRRAKSVGPSNPFLEDSSTTKPRSRSSGSEPKSKQPEPQSIPSAMPRRGRKAKSVGPTVATPEPVLPPRSRSAPPLKKLVVKLKRCDDIWATMTPSTGTSRIMVQLPSMQQLQNAILAQINDSAGGPREEPSNGPELPALAMTVPTPAPLRPERSRSLGSASNPPVPPVKKPSPCVTMTATPAQDSGSKSETPTPTRRSRPGTPTPKRGSRTDEIPKPKKTTRSRTPKPKPNPGPVV